MCTCACVSVLSMRVHAASLSRVQVTKRASESSALQHITASRPRPVGRRKPRKYITYDEDDVSVCACACHGVCVRMCMCLCICVCTLVLL